MTPAEVVEEAGDCTGIIAGVEPYSEETLNRLPHLRCISRAGVGTDSIDHSACRKRGIAVLNTPDEPAVAVAELTVGCILSLLRKLHALTDLTKSRQWKRIPGRLLQGKLVGIIGMGRIGKRVALLLKAFGARIVACDPVEDIPWGDKNDVANVALDDLLRKSDIVCLHASGGNGNLRIAKPELDIMKQGAILINMARGNMVDDVALAEALMSGKIAGAALDVYPEEPYTGPLCDCEQVILTPHEATLTVETRIAMEDRAVENLINYLNDKRNLKEKK
jgi:D-3-phosphoglycerate dehydrogenase